MLAANPNSSNPDFSLVEINITFPADGKIYMETPGYAFWEIMNISNGCNENKVFTISNNLAGTGS